MSTKAKRARLEALKTELWDESPKVLKTKSGRVVKKPRRYSPGRLTPDELDDAIDCLEEIKDHPHYSESEDEGAGKSESEEEDDAEELKAFVTGVVGVIEGEDADYEEQDEEEAEEEEELKGPVGVGEDEEEEEEDEEEDDEEEEEAVKELVKEAEEFKKKGPREWVVDPEKEKQAEESEKALIDEIGLCEEKAAEQAVPAVSESLPLVSSSSESVSESVPLVSSSSSAESSSSVSEPILQIIS